MPIPLDKSSLDNKRVQKGTVRMLKHFFAKKPGEGLPNGLGWLIIAAVDIIVVAFVVIGIGYCNTGCAATSRITRHTPGGDVTIASASYAGGLVSSYSEDFESDGDYARCLADRRSQRVAGGAWIWSDDQMTCYWQTAGATSVGGMPMGGAFGYAWGAPPLTITPGVR